MRLMVAHLYGCVGVLCVFTVAAIPAIVRSAQRQQISASPLRSSPSHFTAAMSVPPSKLKQRVITSPFRSDILKGQVAIITGGGESRWNHTDE